TGSKNGNFFIDNTHGKPRGKVVSVAVYGKLKSRGIVIGEMYDAERLLEKAEIHSQPFKNYMKKKNAFEFAKSEGRVGKDANGREFFSYFTIKDVNSDPYFQKSVDNFYAQEAAGKLKKDSRGEYSVEVIPKGKNGPWEKKLYRSELEGGKEEHVIFIDELENPYAGADQPEMLRKSAGKSFLSKYAKVRNSEAAMDEARTFESVRDYALKMGADDIVGNVEEG
nr:hypothetical protein [Bacteroidales bacterium]